MHAIMFTNISEALLQATWNLWMQKKNENCRNWTRM